MAAVCLCSILCQLCMLIVFTSVLYWVIQFQIYAFIFFSNSSMFVSICVIMLLFGLMLTFHLVHAVLLICVFVTTHRLSVLIAVCSFIFYMLVLLLLSSIRLTRWPPLLCYITTSVQLHYWYYIFLLLLLLVLLFVCVMLWIAQCCCCYSIIINLTLSYDSEVY